jgi:membrane protein implicated in regulation of membrane protease activity
MIGFAIFLVVFGVFVYWRFYVRKGDRLTGRLLAVGLLGLYLASLPNFGASRWFYAPGLTLLAAFYVLQLMLWRRWRRRPTTSPDAPSSDQRRGRES